MVALVGVSVLRHVLLSSFWLEYRIVLVSSSFTLWRSLAEVKQRQVMYVNLIPCNCKNPEIHLSDLSSGYFGNFSFQILYSM